jgi:outer membrane protein OmpA-like peptidoglycan-associated protein
MRYLVLLAGLLGLVSVTNADVAGSGDHPLIPRYPGSEIIKYQALDFDEYTMAVGPRSGGSPASRTIEGKVIRMLYRLTPTERSTLEVFRNYEKAFADAGFEVIFACGRQECGSNFAYEVRYKVNRMPIESKDDTRYLAATLTHASEGQLTVALAVQRYNLSGGSGDPAVWVALDIVEAQAMDVGMELMLADEMSQDLEAEGRAVLYGILFDYDSASIQSQSAQTIAQIAQLLKGDTTLKLLVVGHTDNQGALDYNIDLSSRRAASVVQTLVSEHGISADRLSPHGVGYLAPAAANASENGRAKNRRVELVKQ